MYSTVLEVVKKLYEKDLDRPSYLDFLHWKHEYCISSYRKKPAKEKVAKQLFILHQMLHNSSNFMELWHTSENILRATLHPVILSPTPLKFRKNCTSFTCFQSMNHISQLMNQYYESVYYSNQSLQDTRNKKKIPKANELIDK